MNALHLVRVPIDIDALTRWAVDRGWASGRLHVFDRDMALHHLLNETFGAKALQPFRLMVSPRQHRGNLYAYGAQDEEALRELARATIKPELAPVVDLDAFATKLMPEAWREGQRFGFDVRVRPMRRLLRDIPKAADGRGGFSRGAEVDAFLVEALRLHSDDASGMRLAERAREDVYRDWLAQRLGEAAALECADGSPTPDARMVKFRRSRVVREAEAKGDTKRVRAPEGPDAVFHGTLRVRDPAKFAELLQRGVGRHRAYGFGMLMLFAPGRSAPSR
ncbi:MAG: type I-E CRISPR-associated protein Cas6/Cse3/CasE [Rhodobiaceae bacterium]|nr:type I-E CRISPR-associated protein Cas6/Cse3/CasE [Paracoccaceae bacterium]MCB1474093.1 type I-E CRISPR-associated protein Cas6/Cse3/CasE [Rhodobiaceae bacterium]